ncbi:Conserved coiled/coiled coil protein [Phytophthora cinnamomi]|uniref:Conserved coiled/coiled coil protein n=1 Tax=Phytophthora cinnamomi TaxID=4785 RepID=UPI00355A2016|nr:Conserved coiled/coiled coil protein [Phytophthora cinnamomi]
MAETDGAALKQLQATCKALREEMTALYEQRQAGGSRAKQRRWRVLLLLGAMKSGLRDTFLEADARRARVQEQKDVAEAHQLQLQNLLYEKDHLLREIGRCRGFSTKEMDKIEFADGDVPIDVDPDVHRRHLDQLTQELHARKRLQAELKDIKLKIAKVEDATETKQAFLNALPDHLAGIEAATAGLQKYMGEPVSAQRNRHQAAGAELPTPLYALYCELEAYQTASGEAGKQLTLEIVDAVGVKHAGAFRKRGFPAALERQEHAPAAVKRLKAPSRSPSASVNGATPPPTHSRAPSRSPSAKRAAQEPESGEIVAAHTAEKLLELRPHVSPSEDEETKEENSELKHPHQEHEENAEATRAPAQNLWKPHAKALQLTVSVAAPLNADKSGTAGKTVSGSFTVMFQFFPVAKVVTAEVVKTIPATFNHGSHQRSILMNLFPGDDGLAVPHLAVNYAFQEDSEERIEVEFPANATCRPYYWAQWICGLDPMKRPDPSEMEVDATEEKPRRRPEPSVRNVMSQLVKRFVSTVVLKKHLDQLAKSTGGAHRSEDGDAHFVHPLARHLFPHEVKTRLEEWKESATPPQDVFQLFRESSAHSTRPRAQFHLPTTGCRYFRASFKNGSTSVSAIVEISPEYPVRAPRFIFQPRSSTSSRAPDKNQFPVYENQLKELEIEVNAYYNELTPKGSEHYLLLHQLRKIEVCFDVLCNAAADGDADVSLCFGRERRGKDRRQAMVMDTAAKELRHR